MNEDYQKALLWDLSKVEELVSQAQNQLSYAESRLSELSSQIAFEDQEAIFTSFEAIDTLLSEMTQKMTVTNVYTVTLDEYPNR